MHDHGPGCFCTAKQIQEEAADVLTVRRIVAATAKASGFSESDLLGDRRFVTMAYFRQLAMYVARMRTPLSFPQLGEIFNRDHTTVLHGVRQVNGRVTRAEPGTIAALARIERHLQEEPDAR